MRGAVLYGPGDVRVEARPDPAIEKPTDAVIRVVAACVCGSVLWPYRGVDAVDEPRPMGHEYVGVVALAGLYRADLAADLLDHTAVLLPHR